MTAPPRPSTVQLELTASEQAGLMASACKVQKEGLRAVAALSGLILGGIVVQGMNRVDWIILGLLGIAPLVWVGLVCAFLWNNYSLMTRDLAERRVVCVAGMISLRQASYGRSALGYEMVLPQTVLHVERELAELVTSVRAGTVKYARHSELVLEITDAEGHTIFRRFARAPTIP